jgi:uncharacterized membrane protein YfcA
VPIYTLYLRIPIAYATGASLISTIATSSGAGSAYIKDKITNVKLGMGLGIATTAGSIVGALTVAFMYSHNLQYVIYIVFGSSFSGIHTANEKQIRATKRDEA